MITHHVQKGLATHKIAGAVDRVAVSARRVVLGNEAHRSGKAAGSLRVSSLIAGPHYDANFSDVGCEGLFNQNAENGFFRAVPDKGLQGKRPLISARRCDDRLLDPHDGRSSGELETKEL
jgi:hypothetical protein